MISGLAVRAGRNVFEPGGGVRAVDTGLGCPTAERLDEDGLERVLHAPQSGEEEVALLGARRLLGPTMKRWAERYRAREPLADRSS